MPDKAYKASKYVARIMSGPVCENDEQKMACWQQSGRRNRLEMERAFGRWSRIEGLSNDPEIMALGQKQPGNVLYGHFGWSRSRVAVAAVVILALFAGYMGFEKYTDASVDNNVLRYVTRVGEQKTIRLPDGSVVAMNTGSQVMVDFDANHRRVILDRGEAYFKVEKDSVRPFTAEVGDQAITVLGTEFNVRKDADKQVIVAVTEGLVGLHEKSEIVFSDAPKISEINNQERLLEIGGQYQLESGWIAKINQRSRLISASTLENVERVASWRSGSIRFDAVPLSDVVKELNRYSGKKILIEDALAMDIKVNAIVDINRLDVVLSGLEMSLPIEVKRYVDRYVVSLKDNQK